VALLKRRVRLAAVLALPGAIFLEFRFLMHDHRDVRYLLAAVALAAIAAAWLLESAGPIPGAALRMATLVGVLWVVALRLHATGWRRAVLCALFLAAGAVLSASAARKGAGPPEVRDRPRSRTVQVALAVLALSALGFGAWGAVRALGRFQAAKLGGDEAARFLDRATAAGGARVAYVGSNQPYLFFGSRLQNDVEIVPTEAGLAAQYYRWGGSVHFPFAGGSPSAWRANLILRKIDYVVAARGPREGPERAWMESDPSGFQTLYRDAQTEVWKAIPE
jgi:hypothetical protein